MMRSATTVIVGTGFRGSAALRAVEQMRPGDVVRLQREPDNRHDRNAVACYFLGEHVGYIPRLTNPRIAQALDAGEDIDAIVTAATHIDRGRVMIEPKIFVRSRAVE